MVISVIPKRKIKVKEDVLSIGYISWIKNMLGRKVDRNVGFSTSKSKVKRTRNITKDDIKNYSKLYVFFDCIEKYAENGYITRYEKIGYNSMDIRYYIYYEGIIFILQKEIVKSSISISVYEAEDIDVLSNWRDIIDFNHVINGTYPDDIKYRMDFFNSILNDNDRIKHIKSVSMYESKKDILKEIEETSMYTIPIKPILTFLLYVKEKI